jgi:hypothetical protein
MNNEIQVWFKEASNVSTIYEFNKEDAIIYKGFKLSSYLDGTYQIKDARFEDNYSDVKPVELLEIRSKGFIKGVDDISHRLTKQRLASYKKRVESFYSKRKKAKREMSKDVRLNKKRIRNINKNIDILVDEMFLCHSRINQFNNKYNVEKIKN